MDPRSIREIEIDRATEAIKEVLAPLVAAFREDANDPLATAKTVISHVLAELAFEPEDA